MRRSGKKWLEHWRQGKKKKGLRDGESPAERGQVAIPVTITTAATDVMKTVRGLEIGAAVTIKSDLDGIGLIGTGLQSVLDRLRPVGNGIDMIVVDNCCALSSLPGLARGSLDLMSKDYRRSAPGRG